MKRISATAIFFTILLIGYCAHADPGGTLLVVTGTAIDTNGILDNLVEVTVVGTTTKQVYCNEFGEWTATFEVETGPHSVTASGYDNCGNSYTTPEKIVCAGEITLNITDPLDGSTSGTGGFPYIVDVTTSVVVGGSNFVVARLPFVAGFTDSSGSGPDNSSLLVKVDSQDGAGPLTQVFAQFTITSLEPTSGTVVGTVSGYVEIRLPVDANTDGLAVGVVIFARIDNQLGCPGTDTSTITAQLAHFGLPPVTIFNITGTQVTIPVNAYVDPSENPLLNYDFVITFDTSVVQLAAAADPSSGPFAAPGFTDKVTTNCYPVVCDPLNLDTINASGQFEIWEEGGDVPIGSLKTGVLNLANLTFTWSPGAVVGTTTTIDIELYGGLGTSFSDPANQPLPADRPQAGSVTIVLPPPIPEITNICDGGYDTGNCAPPDPATCVLKDGNWYDLYITGANFVQEFDLTLVGDDSSTQTWDGVDDPGYFTDSGHIKIGLKRDAKIGDITGLTVRITNVPTGMSGDAPRPLDVKASCP